MTHMVCTPIIYQHIYRWWPINVYSGMAAEWCIVFENHSIIIIDREIINRELGFTYNRRNIFHTTHSFLPDIRRTLADRTY